MHEESARLAHLSVDHIAAYRQKRLPLVELLVTDQHLAGCAVCRTQLQATGPPPQVPSTWQGTDTLASEHLSYAQMEAYVDARLDDIERNIVEGHIALCQPCVRELHDLQAFAAGLAVHKPLLWCVWWETLVTFWRVPQYRFAGAMAVVAVLVALVAIPLFRSEDEQTRVAHEQGATPATTTRQSCAGVPVSGTQQALPQERVPLERTGPGPEPEYAGEALLGSVKLESLPVPYREQVQMALRAKQPEIPAALHTLSSSGGETTQAERDQAAFTLRSPANTVIEPDYPTFVWEALQGASAYTVSIFYVLAQDTATELTQVRAQYPHTHLLLGVLYLQAGLLDDAERELAKLRTASSDTPESQKLWYDLQYLRQVQD